MSPQNVNTFHLRIKRQDGPDQPPYWQTFAVPHKPQMNVISALQYVAADPVTVDGEQASVPAWDAGCLEEVCGSCTMNVNGHVRQACSALISELLDSDNTVTLEPMTKFPVIRDLFVDRQRMFDALKQVRGWVPIDSTQDLGPGPRESQENQAERYALSRCMTCGCCLEACPQFQQDTDFIGPQAIAQALYFNEHETGQALADERLDALMGPGGITDCGNAQNCVKVCPKDVPLTEAIAKIGRQTTARAFKRFFRK
jgi:succinate dehydrogenase / fumarate reductase iron-sulfur subunit